MQTLLLLLLTPTLADVSVRALFQNYDAPLYMAALSRFGAPTLTSTTHDEITGAEMRQRFAGQFDAFRLFSVTRVDASVHSANDDNATAMITQQLPADCARRGLRMVLLANEAGGFRLPDFPPSVTFAAIGLWVLTVLAWIIVTCVCRSRTVDVPTAVVDPAGLKLGS